MKRTNWRRRRRIEDILIMVQAALIAAFTIVIIAILVARCFCVISRLPREPTGSKHTIAGERKGSHTASNK